MILNIILYKLLILSLSPNGGDNVSENNMLTKRVVQTKYSPGHYLESGSIYGDGSVFYNYNRNIEYSVTHPDTIYQINILSQKVDFTSNDIYITKRLDSLKYKDWCMRRKINKYSIHRLKVKNIQFNVVDISFKIDTIYNTIMNLPSYYEGTEKAFVKEKAVTVVEISQ